MRYLVFGALLVATVGGCFGLRPPLAADDTPSPFFVAPYLIATDSGQPELRWWPVEAFADPHLELWQGEPDAIVLGAAEREGVYSVALPLRCEAATPLRYRVPGMGEPRALRLPPCPEEERVRFALWSDTQGSGKHLDRAAELIAGFDPAFVLHAGDMVDRGSSEQQWIDLFEAANRFGDRSITVATLGNHELYMHEDFREFRRFVGDDARTWLHFAAGPVDVLVIDSEQEDEALQSEQLAWVEETLRALAAAPDAGRRWRLVVTHHAPHSSGLANARWVPFDGAERLRTHYQPIFERHGVDLVISGHTHVHERLEQGGITYLVSGTVSGFMGLMGKVHPDSRFVAKARTITTFEADPTSLILETRALGGEVLDSLRLERDPPGEG